MSSFAERADAHVRASRPAGLGPTAIGQATTALEQAAPWLLATLGLLTRLFHVNANGLRTDELYSLAMASRSIPDLLGTIVLEGHDATPPTYYLLLNLMLHLSWDLWAVRLVSIVAGAVTVWLTFHLARRFFDFRTAALSGMLAAVSPFAVEISQVARAYAVVGVFALASMLCFARLNAAAPHRRIAWLYAIFTLLAISTHYLAGLVLVVQNLIVLALAAAGRLARRQFWNWVRFQFVVGLIGLPVIWMAMLRVPTRPGGGQTWLSAPSFTGMARTLILWGTGDPSYGPGGFTLPRLASLIVILAILGLGSLTAWRLWQRQPERRREIAGVGYVAVMFFATWGLATGISMVRKIFNEKYFIYLAPLLLILLAWSALKIRPLVLGRGLLLALVGLNGLGLVIYHTSPTGEQWREAAAYVGHERQPGDYVVTVPGFYMRPLAYYLEGVTIATTHDISDSGVAVLQPEGIVAARADSAQDTWPAVTASEAVRPAQRVWLVTGYAHVSPADLAWYREQFVELSRHEFLGVQVILGERR